MNRSQIVSTPVIIQRAWNDGLYILREKRNNILKGTTIEEKVMYVLGLGWKHKGLMEIKDSEIENTLYISLIGLSQEAKFLKIGQVLWEQCSEDFILKMITSLSNIGPAQTRTYQQISQEAQKEWRGYFSRRNRKMLTRHGIDPSSILKREAGQTQRNLGLTDANKEKLRQQRQDLAYRKISSKGLERRMLRFKPDTKEGKKLIAELDMVLKASAEKENLVQIAIDLGLTVESGYNKNYLIEEIKEAVVSYVEGEILNAAHTRWSSRNVYIRQTSIKGIETIKRLLRYTSFAILGMEGNMTVAQIKAIGNQVESMRDKVNAFTKGSGEFNVKKFNKEMDRQDKFIDRVKRRETKRFDTRRKFKVKASDAKKLYDFLSSVFTVRNDSGTLVSWLESGGKYLFDENAVRSWIKTYTSEKLLAEAIVANDTSVSENIMQKLVFEGYNSDELLGEIIGIAGAMGLEKELIKISKESFFLPSSPTPYLIAIIRRFISLHREANKFRLSRLGRDKRRGIVADIEKTIVAKKAARAKEELAFSKSVDGVFKPVDVSGDQLKKWYTSMQPVYVLGGSIYSFNGGIGGSSGSLDTNALNLGANQRKQYLKEMITGSGKLSGRDIAFMRSSAGENMGAFGTIEPLLEQKDGETGEEFLRRVVAEKSSEEIKKLLLAKNNIQVRDSIQPVFLVNKGINTSNVEMTALLNMLPSMFEAIPLLGSAVSSLVRGMLQSEVDAAKNLPKFAKGGSFSTYNSNVSQFISGDSINNKVNPERVTIDWKSQRVNVQPLQNINNVTNVETGRVSDPILGTPIIKVESKVPEAQQAISVYNAINPFEEEIQSGDLSVTPLDVLLSLKESLVDIVNTLVVNGQNDQFSASMNAKAVDKLTELIDSVNSSGSGANLFSSINKLARGD